MRSNTSSASLVRAQKALQESEARRQSLLDFALDCVICADGKARITDFNPAAERTFRISRSETIGKDLANTILPATLRDRLRRSLFTSDGWGNVDVIGNRLETRCLRADGTEFSAELTVTQVIIEKQVSYTVYVRDITARRIAEETLVRLAAIVESSQDAIIGKDLACRITSWNKGAELTYGYSASEAIGQNISMLAPAGRSHEIAQIIEDLKAGHPIQNFETIRMARSGKLIDVSLTVSPVLNSEGILVGASTIARDITTQKLADEALRRANETSIYASPVPIIAADAESRVSMWNPAAEALFGWTEAEVLGKPMPIIPQHLLAEAAEIHLRLLSGETLRGIEVCREKRDGSSVTISLSAAPIRDANRRVKGILGFLADITDRKRSEEALRQAEEKYRTIFEHAVEGIYQTTPDGKYISANPALARMLGFDSPEELISVRNDITTQEYVKPEMRAEFARTLEDHDVVQNFEYEAYRHDGNIIWVSAKARAVRDQNGRMLYFEGTVEDITHRRELEHQLRQMQKIEAIGRLAGGVAHDFNNILMAISSYAELLDKKLPDVASRRYAGEIVKATERGSSLTEGLLTFSRKQVLSPRVLDLNHLIKEQIKMLQRLIPENIELSLVPGESLGRIKADPSQMGQVLMNLVINARDAMPNGGQVLIRTGNAELAPSVPGQPIAQPHVMISVKDSGCGMSAKTKSQIFEPFFTTKEQGKGTGLGLAIVFGIVKQSAGQIFVDSEVDKGSTFRIYFPLVEGAVQSEDFAALEAPVSGSETILLVEDEDAVRESTADYLTANGYTVLRARAGPEALQMAKDFDQTIHLLLTDLVMPQMSGRELSEKITSARPETRVVFMSGYSNNLLSNQQTLESKHVLLQKPFRLSALGQCIREVLARARGAAAG